MYGTDTSRIAPVYELFFAPLEVEFEPNVFERIQSAYIMSKFGHHDQKRDDGSRYFDHPKGACWIYINELNGRDPQIIIDLLLHDMQEDSRLLSPYRIALNFGKEVALDVRAVTKIPKKKESVEAYLTRIITRGERAIVAKLCDRLHNLRTLNASSKEKQVRQIKETREHYLPTLILALDRAGGRWTELANILGEKIEEALNVIEKLQEA